jgi:hypothetical protein
VPSYLYTSLLLYTYSPPYSLALANYASSYKPIGLSTALVVDIATAAKAAVAILLPILSLPAPLPLAILPTL